MKIVDYTLQNFYKKIITFHFQNSFCRICHSVMSIVMFQLYAFNFHIHELTMYDLYFGTHHDDDPDIK
jgi:hypothetical protein